MKVVLVVTVFCLQVWLVLSSTSPSPGTCSANGCTCEDDDDTGSGITKQEGLAAAIGVMTPMVIGGAGLGLYKMLKGGGSSLSPSEAPSSMSSPRLAGKPGPFDPKDSPQPYHGSRRGSTPVSLFGEDDELSFDESPRSPRPDTSSAYTNIHRPYKDDAINRWM